MTTPQRPRRLQDNHDYAWAVPVVCIDFSIAGPTKGHKTIMNMPGEHWGVSRRQNEGKGKHNCDHKSKRPRSLPRPSHKCNVEQCTDFELSPTNMYANKQWSTVANILHFCFAQGGTRKDATRCNLDATRCNHDQPGATRLGKSLVSPDVMQVKRQ